MQGVVTIGGDQPRGGEGLSEGKRPRKMPDKLAEQESQGKEIKRPFKTPGKVVNECRVHHRQCPWNKEPNPCDASVIQYVNPLLVWLRLI